MELSQNALRQTFRSRTSVTVQPEPTDADCIARVRQGDRAAFDTLVVRYQDRLSTTLTRLMGSADDALDIAQDAFVQAFTKLDSFQQNSAFYTWLYRIAFNLAMSHARKRRPVSIMHTDDRTCTIEPASTESSPDDLLQQSERAAQVHAAIQQLPEEHRVVVVLRELEGCDYQQIADILDIPVGTVRSRLFRARTQLKEKLATMVE
ncbi:sigma-70 family RNA polymerase sigma factor [Aeoliella mucimassa]|nr:sigma-70 family RNA polymerase sigma factor [Aeoliella mucimassa]